MGTQNDRLRKFFDNDVRELNELIAKAGIFGALAQLGLLVAVDVHEQLERIADALENKNG